MFEDAMAPETEAPSTGESTIMRERPEPDAARAALVKAICDDVRQSREHWNRKAFKRMRDDMAFAAGRQWPGAFDKKAIPADEMFVDAPEDRYVANIVLRHIQQRTATLYGKNPRIIARRREKLMSQVWDGNVQTLQTAMQTVQSGMLDPMALAILQDAQQAMMENQRLTKIGKTLELLFQHEVDEQALPFKVQMKATIRKALTTGVGYVKLGYQRVMDRTPATQRALSDASDRLATLERLAADVADGEKPTDAPEMEQLRLMIQSLSQQQEVLVREGLSIAYPDSWAIIPQKTCRQLRGFIGCAWVAEEYFLTCDEIKELYQRDVGSGATTYCEGVNGAYTVSENAEGTAGRYCVWEVYNRKTGVVYVVCDGYPEFLQEPSEPDVWLERFWPWFPMVFNEVYDDENIYPPSDVQLIRDMQLELNRARQGLREHRRANRPKTYARKGVLEETDKDAIQSAQAHTIIELQGLSPGEDIRTVLQAHAGPNIDPSLYDTNPAYEDILRVAGQQEANLGGTSGATATESSIAEGSRMSSVSSTIDDLDEFLTEFARSAGQVLLRETSPQTVQEVVGPGAMWPQFSRDELARELYLDVEAASTGRPNQAQEIQNAQQIFPLIMQVPGISPEWVARELIRRLDDRLDLTDAFAVGLPSIQMLNRSGQMTPGGPDTDPNAQGAEGANNAPSTEPDQVNAAPRPPGPMPQAGPGPL